MSYEERGTWLYLIVSAGVYLGYAAIVLSNASTPLTETAYQLPLLWSIVIAIVAAIVLRILVEIGAGVARGIGDGLSQEMAKRTGASPSSPTTNPFRADARDREIDRVGNARTWPILALAALGALLMALAELHFFWIANVIFLGFVLQAVASSIVKIVIYRRGF